MLRKTVGDGETVVRAGEPGAAAWRVVSGAVVLRGPGPDALARPGAIIGAGAALTGAAHARTGEARGPTVLEMLPRADLARLLTAAPEAANRLLALLFAEAGAEAGARIRLRPLEPDIAEAMGTGVVEIEALPFVVGRSEYDGEGTARGVDLAIPDRRPFTLSRRHFAIEQAPRGHLVRDCGSYHGTFVNGVLIGSGGTARTAPLNAGENEIVAGPISSPFRFCLEL